MLSGTYEMELRGGIRLTTGRQYRENIQDLIRNWRNCPVLPHKKGGGVGPPASPE